MKKSSCFLLAVALSTLPLLSAPLVAEESPLTLSSPKIWDQDTLTINNWYISTQNNMAIDSYIGGRWGGPSYNYIYGGGVWFVAVDSASRRLASRGYDLGPGAGEFGPVNPYTESYENWLEDSLARVYLSTDPADTAQWPLQASGSPVILSEQDSYSKYSDQNPYFAWGIAPLNIVVEQRTFAWNQGAMANAVLFNFKIKNKNDYQLDSCYLGMGIDADIGCESGTNADDRTDFDCMRNLVMQFQNTPEPGWPVTGCVGFRYLKSPVNNNGYPVDVIDDQYPHSIPPGQSLGLTAFTICTIDIDPHNDEECYSAMEGRDWYTGVMDAYDQWGTVSYGDKRFVMASGPFLLAAYDSVEYCIAVLAALDTASLKIVSDSVNSFYEATLGVGANSPFRPAVQELWTQNLPNPFRQFTTINYHLTKPGLVSLKVYNAAGQMVRTLVGSHMPAGRYAATWDGRDEQGDKVSAGVYLYQIQAGDRALTRKMVLVR